MKNALTSATSRPPRHSHSSHLHPILLFAEDSTLLLLTLLDGTQELMCCPTLEKRRPVLLPGSATQQDLDFSFVSERMSWKISKIHESQREQLVPVRQTWVPISPLTFSVVKQPQALKFATHSLCTRHWSEDFCSIISCNPHSNPVIEGAFTPIVQRNRGSERISDLLKGAQVVNMLRKPL